MEYRLIIVSNENGSRETVYFCDSDNEDPVEDFCAPGQTVDFDEIIEADLPSSFPLESALEREV